METDRIETIILHSLLTSQTFSDRVLSHLHPKTFHDLTEQCICEGIQSHCKAFPGTLPDSQALLVTLSSRKDIQQEDYEAVKEYLAGMETHKQKNPLDWLLHQAEKFIRERRLHHSTLDLIAVQAGKDRKKTISKCLDEIKEAESFTLDEKPELGLDWNVLYADLKAQDEKFPFELDRLNEMTCGGVRRKTLNCVIAPTGTGKTLWLCDQAVQLLNQGRTVAYLTLETSNKRLLHRMFANILKTDMNTLAGWSQIQWTDAMNKVKIPGTLRLAEYGAKTASVREFRRFLADLKTKERLTPDVIIVDYLNECKSGMSYAANTGMYQVVGTIASELRALATEFNAAVWTATQTNRDGYEGDPTLKNTSESAQVNSVADLIVGVLCDPPLGNEQSPTNRFRCRVLKNRNEELKDGLFMLGVNRRQQRLMDLEESVVEQLNQKRAEANGAKKAARFSV